MNDRPRLPSPQSFALYHLIDRIRRDADASRRATAAAISASRQLLEHREVKLVIRAKHRRKFSNSPRNETTAPWGESVVRPGRSATLPEAPDEKPTEEKGNARTDRAA